MPIYEFRCPSCKQSFDVMRSRAKAGDPAVCPDDGTNSQRVFSSSAILTGKAGGDFDFGDMGGGMPDMEGMGGMPDMGDLSGMDF
jgi:putative FmdB family regulatory protein